MGIKRNAEARLLSTCQGISRWLDESGDARPPAETRLRCEIDGKLADRLLGPSLVDRQTAGRLRTA